jgi:hypothetical protein
MHTMVKFFRVTSPTLEALIDQMEQPLNEWLKEHAPQDATIAPQTQLFYLQDAYHLIVTLTVQRGAAAGDHARMGFQLAT